eukprot:1377496-Amorphochlora_amoeboformis.AAC.1
MYPGPRHNMLACIHPRLTRNIHKSTQDSDTTYIYGNQALRHPSSRTTPLSQATITQNRKNRATETLTLSLVKLTLSISGAFYPDTRVHIHRPFAKDTPLLGRGEGFGWGLGMIGSGTT